MEQSIVEDLVTHDFYGFDMKKVVVVPQPQLPGYTWEEDGLHLATTEKFLYYGTGYAVRTGRHSIAYPGACTPGRLQDSAMQ